MLTYHLYLFRYSVAVSVSTVTPKCCSSNFWYLKVVMYFYIHPASVHTRLSLHSRGDWCQSPVVIGREVGCNLGCLTCFGNPTVVLFSNRSGKKVFFFFFSKFPTGNQTQAKTQELLPVLHQNRCLKLKYRLLRLKHLSLYPLSSLTSPNNVTC